MSYVDGYVLAVPTDKKKEYIEVAKITGELFKEYGALKIIETWGDDVPTGELTSFPMAVKCQENETVVFSLVVWPDKSVRNEAWTKMHEDPRMQPENLTMPFDGKRLIYGGFESILEL